MANNPLYYLLRYLQESNSTELPQSAVEFSKKQYAMIPLKGIRRSVTIKKAQHWIEEAHLTIFNDCSKCFHDSGVRSDSHYTAKIVDAAGNSFSLHVYFDKSNKMIGELSYKSDNTTIKLDDVDKKMLIDMAVMTSASFMTNLREIHQSELAKLANSVKSLIEKLFSMPTNTIEDIKILLSWVKKSKALYLIETYNNLGGTNNLYLMAKDYLDRVDWMHRDLLALTTENLEIKKATSDNALSHEKDEKPLAVLSDAAGPAYPTKEDPAEQDKQRRAGILKRCLDQLKAIKESCQLPKEVAAEQLTLYYTAAQDALAALLDCEKNEILGNAFIVINESLMVSQTLCVTRLEKAILENDVATKEALSDYLSYLPATILADAITRDDTAQLRWLLSKGRFSLNQMGLCYQKADGTQQSLSPLAFAVAQNKPACFALLLEYGASSLIMGDDGLPLAHHLLGKQVSVFAMLLQKHYAGTNYKACMNQLIYILREYLDTQALEATVKTKLEQDIKNYTRDCRNVPNTSTLELQRHFETEYELTVMLKGATSDAEWERIHNNPEVIELKRKLDDTRAAHLRLLPQGKSRGIFREGTVSLQKDIKDLKASGKRTWTSEDMLMSLRRQLMIEELCLREEEVRQDIQKHRYKGKAEYSALIRELIQIDEEIKQLNSDDWSLIKARVSKM